MEVNKLFFVCVISLLFLCLLVLTFLIIKEKYFIKLLVKFGLKSSKFVPNWTLISWKSSLEKMGCEFDIAFFGDSITRGGEFNKAFSDYKVINLGISGDTLNGMTDRISMLTSVSPKKIFIMGGINGTTFANIDVNINKYLCMIEIIKKQLPNSEIYVQSVLPISKSRESFFCNNDTIIKFNEKLLISLKDKNVTYIDLHKHFYNGKELHDELSKDGLHINQNGYDLWVNQISEYIKKQEVR